MELIRSYTVLQTDSGSITHQKVTLKEIIYASKQIINASVGLLGIEIHHVTMLQFNP